MMFFVYVALVVAVFMAVSASWYVRDLRNLKRAVRENFGKPPQEQDYGLGSIESYHACKSASEGAGEYIDDITWGDLDMDKIFRRINACHTSVGEEYLYSCLREPQFDTAGLELREAFIQRMKAQPEARFKIQMCLARLGKLDFNGLADLIYSHDRQPLKYAFIYNIFALLPVLFGGLIFINAFAGIAGLVASLMLNTAVSLAKRRAIEHVFATVNYFLSMLWHCKKLRELENFKSEPFLARLHEPFMIFKPLIWRSTETISKSSNETGMLNEFLRMWFLSDVRSYNKIIGSVSRNKARLHDLYKMVGELDMAICVLSYRESLSYFAKPEFHAESRRLDFEEIYHPLLDEPVANNGAIANNSIITGSNASGKSTFIKTLAVNGILAQAIYTCTARAYASRPALVMTSMALRDDISEGESYFITEIKSLKRILDKIKSVYCVCFIDEILRGTNTTERVAASAAILAYLGGMDCLCLAASHDIELARMLDGAVDNYHFREQITDSGMAFDYKIRRGISNTRNAIKLLRHMGFDSAIVENAEKLAGK